jgi:hypothetical protein
MEVNPIMAELVVPGKGCNVKHCAHYPSPEQTDTSIEPATSQEATSVVPTKLTAPVGSLP